MSRVKRVLKEMYGTFKVINSNVAHTSPKGNKQKGVELVCTTCDSTLIIGLNALLQDTKGRCKVCHPPPTRTRLYPVWRAMVRRCTLPSDKNYAYYGATGITICEEWLDYQTFLKDMEPSYVEGLTIDRIDNTKGYSPDNCRWTDYGTQNHNRLLKHRNKDLPIGSCLKDGKYRVTISYNYKRMVLGEFRDKEDAKLAYDTASFILYGDRPNLTEYRDTVVEYKVQIKVAKKVKQMITNTHGI